MKRGMKKFLFTALLFSLFCLPSIASEDLQIKYAEEVKNTINTESLPEESHLKNIFIWEIPDKPLRQEEINLEDNSGIGDDETAESIPEETGDVIELFDEPVAKGYIEYSEGSNDIILKKPDKDFVLNLSVPQEFETLKASDAIHKLPQTNFARSVYSKTDDISYNIAPLDTSAVTTYGDFSFGTAYNESIDTSDLGFTTSFFTKYEKKYFSLSSSYDKNSGVSYSTVVDKFSFAPEFKLNDHISIKDVLTSDITRNRKENSLILSIKPTKTDRVRFEFGAGQTYDENRAVIKSQLKFSTQFKW